MGQKEYYKGKPPVVGLVVHVDSHPRADRLHLATIDVATPRNFQIVFGGERVLQKGETVAVALPGTLLPNGEKIRKRKWRGIVSEGELLSSDELGWTVKGPDEVVVLDGRECTIGQQLDHGQIIWDLANASYDRQTPGVVPYFLSFMQLARGLPKGKSVVR